MPSFCVAFNCSNRADREKNKSNYRFPSIVKSNGKEGLKLLKVRREKWLAQIFRKHLNERKLEKQELIEFHTKFTILHLKSKYLFYPGNRTWTASVGVHN